MPSDEEGLNKFFLENKSKYTLDGEKYKGMIVYAKDIKSLTEAQNMLQSTDTREVFTDKIRGSLNKDSVTVTIEPDYGKKAPISMLTIKYLMEASQKYRTSDSLIISFQAADR